MRILLTNDDGIDAPGLIALYRAIAGLGDVYVVAPATVQSAMSHAVTFHRPIPARPRKISDGNGGTLFEGFAVEGSPADCVKLALANILPEPMDLVISGMNGGANVGVNVNYSGTVAAAREAAFMGVPAVAVSLHIGAWERTRWPDAARRARTVLDRLLAVPLEPHTLLNLNVPISDHGDEPRGVRVAPICTGPLVDDYAAHNITDDPSDSVRGPASPAPGNPGHASYTAASGMKFRDTRPGTDVDLLFQGYVTVTPMHFDPTHHAALAAWRARVGSAG